MIQTLFSFMAYKENNMNYANGPNTFREYYIRIQKAYKITFEEFMVWFTVWNLPKGNYRDSQKYSDT